MDRIEWNIMKDTIMLQKWVTFFQYIITALYHVGLHTNGRGFVFLTHFTSWNSQGSVVLLYEALRQLSHLCWGKKNIFKVVRDVPSSQTHDGFYSQGDSFLPTILVIIPVSIGITAIFDDSKPHNFSPTLSFSTNVWSSEGGGWVCSVTFMHFLNEG